MVRSNKDERYLMSRVDDLLEETSNGNQNWVKRTPRKFSTMYNVVVPDDGENYFVRVSLIKMNSKGDTKYFLVNHETGLLASSDKLRSGNYEPLRSLGDLVFNE